MSTFLAACGGGENNDENAGNGDDGNEKQVLNLYESAELPSMDTTQATDAVSFNIMNNVFEGLYRLDKDNKPVEGMAKDVQKSEDGLTYTFTLREDAVWSDGSPVTAHDFVFAWRKVNNPESLSEYAYIMDPVKNAAAVQAGEMPVEKLGVTAVDDHTLKVELSKPIPYLLSLTTFPTFYPQKEEYVNEQGSQFALEDDKMLYNGPFVMQDWKQGQGFKLVKNDEYWDKNTVKLEQANYNIIKDTSARVNLYEAGDIDRAVLSAEYVDQYKDHKEFNTFVDPTVAFFRLNQTNELLKNKDIRLAINMGWDKQGMIDVILNNGSIPANFIVPKDFVANENGEGFREKYPEFNKTDIEKAKEHWQKGLQTLGKDQAELEFLNFDTESSKKIGEYIKNQLEKNLEGLTLTIKQQPFKQKLALESKLDYDISFSIWGPDYQDPMTYLDMFVTGNPHNEMDYSNPEYDKLIQDAQSETDVQKRWEMLQEAERILLEEDAAITPMYQRGNAYMQRSFIKDLYLHPFGPEFSLKWAHVE
ncbi:peptide ABC transporter substrate-binding protein [Bacillus marinisedimentorum]|uniref:peptide ABC transporter substrate-binding protein n=1 Tax=Bacillus marinisedimentorum TaxID=1821260 RepID=UPI000871FE3F|nr:peptide ABC transporter substrate-binding protein [Bacillus marinisedimentorum]